MSPPRRPVAYVLAATGHGSMIVNRNDHVQIDAERAFGVGFQLLSHGAYDPAEVELAVALLNLRKDRFGPGVVAVDAGANIGVHTIEWARAMHGWGRVIAFEAQEYVFYALAGNIALNNCWNASARWAALGEAVGSIDIPEPDYQRSGSFGSLELRPLARPEFIGQDISYDAEDCVRTPMVSIDSLALERLDFLKVDVEGMEDEVLRGARETLRKHQPIVMLEVVKSDVGELVAILRDLGYRTTRDGMGMNMLAIHAGDPSGSQFTHVTWA